MELSELLMNMNLVCGAVQRLNNLSHVQERMFDSDDLPNLQSTFVERQVLFEYVRHHWAVIQNILEQSEEFNMSMEVASLNDQIEEAAVQFLECDERMSALLTKHLDKIQFALAERFRAKAGVKDYETIERVTDPVSRIFPGNTRYFDEQS